MASWVWWGGEPAAFLRSWRLQERAVDGVRRSGREDVPKGLHGWVEQKPPQERRFFSSAKITRSGPKWEVSRAGRLVNPTLGEEGTVASGRHLKEGMRSRGATILLEVELKDSIV